MLNKLTMVNLFKMIANLVFAKQVKKHSCIYYSANCANYQSPSLLTFFFQSHGLFNSQWLRGYKVFVNVIMILTKASVDFV